MYKKNYFFICVAVSILFLSCNFDLLSDNSIEEANNSAVIQIGDEVIYGERISLNNIYSENNRAANIAQDNLVGMVYFSGCPTSIDEVYKVNDKLGYLNPIMLNYEILQACDSESMIIKENIEPTEEITAENLVNVGINYYYIVKKSEIENYMDLENYTVN